MCRGCVSCMTRVYGVALGGRYIPAASQAFDSLVHSEVVGDGGLAPATSDIGEGRQDDVAVNLAGVDLNEHIAELVGQAVDQLDLGICLLGFAGGDELVGDLRGWCGHADHSF